MIATKQTSSLVRNIIRVMAANFWVAVVGFLGSFVFPKILSVNSYALYHTFTLYLGYIAVAHLGFPTGMVINYAGCDYSTIDRRQYKSEVLLVIFILVLVTLFFFIAFCINSNMMTLYIAMAVIPVGVLGGYRALLQSWGRFKSFSRISTILTTSVPLAALLFYYIRGALSGDSYIIIYLIINWCFTFYVISEVLNKVHGVKANRIFSSINWDTEKTGFALMIGNYINTLFVSADKQFVKWYFDTNHFAYYSFGMAMQAIMTIFITSIAQPLLPTMAKGSFRDDEYNRIKKLLFVFGSMSGCAYFALSIVVKLYIQNYVESLDIIRVYFLVFPAMAVINCLYVNLYKIKRMTNQYIWTLTTMLGIAILLNLFMVHVFKDYTGVAIATVVVYYAWLFLGLKQFDFIKFSPKDLGFLFIFTAIFVTATLLFNDYIGFIVYLIVIGIADCVFYGNEIKYYIDLFLKKGDKHDISN